MKVKTLIALLSKHDPEARVLVDGYECGYDDLHAKRIRPVRVVLNVYRQDYAGPHETLKPGERGGRKAVLLARSGS
jgi:hypothetical protein